MATDNSDLEIARQFLVDNPDIEIIEVLLTDLNGILRGKWIPRSKLDSVFAGGLRLPLTAVTPDIWGRDVPSLCSRTGDGDGITVPTVRTLHRVNWLKRPTAQMFLHLTDEGEEWGCDPRVILRKVQKRFSDQGLTPVVAPELEFMLLPTERDEDGIPQLPGSRMNRNMTLGGQLYSTDLMHEFSDVLHEMREACDEMNLGLDTLVKELAPAQYELNLHHIGDPLLAADNSQLLKRAIKGIAQKHNLIATFMPKPFPYLDGNGFHTHISVLDRNGENIFDDGTDDGSAMLRHAIAGLAASMPDTMLIYAPHRNSYRRFSSGSHMPIAATWGYENRDVALRVPIGDPKARRIEHRVAGADANPYLVLAAILAGVLDGLENEMPASEPIVIGAPKPERTLPTDWRSSLRRFQASTFTPRMLGEPFHAAFAAVKQFELDEFDRTVMPFEYDTYLVNA